MESWTLGIWLQALAAFDFQSQVAEISPDLLKKMQAVSLHEGCPVPATDLRYLHLSYWSFAGRPEIGELVVHSDVVDDVVAAFRAMFALGFQIEKMRLVEAYGGSDDKSMQDNNTSSFNCRFMTEKKVFSNHSYGRAIDINPRTNPYVNGKVVAPANASAYLDRTQKFAGSILEGSEVITIWRKLGWAWGGEWTSPKDYQHFEKTPRTK